MYVAGNPLRLTDSSGHFWETVADVVSVGYDVYDIYENGLTWSSGGALVVDVAGAAIPFVPSAGTCVRWCDDAWQYGSKAAGWVGDKADEGWQAAKSAMGWSDEAASAAKAGADCLVNSFSADTLVMTPSGLKPIAELVEGELVLAYNEATGEMGAYPIVDTISHVDPEIVLLTIDGETLETTAEHPFYELESTPWLAAGQTKGRWTDALDLKAGDRVWKADGTNGIVKSVVVVPVEQRMYNLTAAEAHTFFVGEQQWLVHNCRIRTPLDNATKDAYRSSARDLWEAATGRRAIWDKQDVHHIIPLEWAHIFPDADPNRLSNLASMTKTDHTLVTNAWNGWRKSLNGATPTSEQVLQKAREIYEQYGNHMVVLN